MRPVILIYLLIGMTACPKLREIFSDSDFAWRLLEAEANLHINRQVTLADIAALSQLYMKAVEVLNSRQDQREKFFSQRMQKFMAEPFVIRCFNKKDDSRQSHMEYKRKEIEQIVSQEHQKARPERLQQMISQYGEKQKKIKSKIDKILQQHDRVLESRLRKRVGARIDRMSYIESLETTSSNRKTQPPQQPPHSQFFNPETSRATTATSQFQQSTQP